jgi:hypothetical protein
MVWVLPEGSRGVLGTSVSSSHIFAWVRAAQTLCCKGKQERRWDDETTMHNHHLSHEAQGS